MDKQTALRAFTQLEAFTYEFNGDEYPSLNVRLDAMTTRGDDERGFRLFARVDPNTPDREGEDNLRGILDVAKELELGAAIDNGGVELT